MRIFLLGLLAVTCTSAAAMTMTEVIHLALQQSPAFDSAQKALALSELQFKNAQAKFLPSVDFTTTDGLQNLIPIASNNGLLLATNPTAPWYSTLTLGATENLYDNGVSITGFTIANLTRDLARVNALKARDSLTLNVATEFYNYSLSAALLKVRKQQQAMLEKQYTVIGSRYQQGFKTRADYLRIKTQVQQAGIDSISAENSIQQSAAHLKQLMGVNVKGQDVTFDALEADPKERFVSLRDGKGPNLDEFYDSRASKIQKEINEKSVDLARRNYYPQINLNSGISYNNQNYINSGQPYSAGNQATWDVLVTLTYNFWDWGIQRRNVEIAKNNRDTQADTLDTGLQQTYATVEQMMADIARVSKTYELTQQLLRDETESNNLVESQYRDGKVTYLDLITSLNNLLAAKVQLLTAYFNALQDLAQLNYYRGKIYGSLVDK